MIPIRYRLTGYDIGLKIPVIRDWPENSYGIRDWLKKLSGIRDLIKKSSVIRDSDPLYPPPCKWRVIPLISKFS